jgi:hypothetical protein
MPGVEHAGLQGDAPGGGGLEECGLESGSGSRRLPGSRLRVHGGGLQAEGVVSRRNHRQRNRRPIRPAVEVLGFQPGTEPWIVNLRLVLPEIGRQPTLNLQMIQLQLDDLNALGKISPDIGNANVQSSQATALGMCFDHHTHLLFNVG